MFACSYSTLDMQLVFFVPHEVLYLGTLLDAYDFHHSHCAHSDTLLWSLIFSRYNTVYSVVCHTDIKNMAVRVGNTSRKKVECNVIFSKNLITLRRHARN